MTAMYFAILSLGHMEEELSTACRAAADALEILSNLRPGFTRNVISRINSSTAVSVSQVYDEELQANEVPFNPRRRQPQAVPGADPGFFLGGGAPLRNGVTNTHKPLFFAEYQLYQKAVGHLREGCAPPAPSP